LSARIAEPRDNRCADRGLHGRPSPPLQLFV
jgi:hypothetical protein